MICALGWSLKHNKVYKGACSSTPDRRAKEHIHAELIEVMGLSHVLPFACPGNASSAVFLTSGDGYQNPKTLSREQLRSMRKRPFLLANDTDFSISKVVAHIRRGDVTPCLDGSSRYTPNLLYTELLQNLVDSGKYKPQEVAILSESKSVEPFLDEFSQYNLMLDGSLAEAFDRMINAEVLITGKSTFSALP
jgi:hypothetical protein